MTVPRKPGQPMRTAHLTLRYQAVTLRLPRHRSAEQLASVPVTAVWALEEAPPPGCTPIEWLLLTTCAVTTAEQAGEVVAWYACRWGIEVWHNVLKL